MRDRQLTQSVAAARQAFAMYVATEGARVDAFRRAVATRGGPTESELDLSRDSLRALGAWFLQPLPPGPEDELDPHWAVIFPEGHPDRQRGWLLDGLTSYFAAALRRRHPELSWRLNEDRRHESYLRPVLGSFNGAHFWPFTPVAGQWKQTTTQESPDRAWLVKLFDYWSARAPAEAAAQDGVTSEGDDNLRELQDVEIEPIKGYPDWNADLWITEAAEPILGEREFERLEARFAAIPGVERVGWEDREHFLLRLRKGSDIAVIRDAARRELRKAYEAAKTQSIGERTEGNAE